ncbi:MAG: 16S rRNA (adenine(1518)-N(6)/adenine(1519)-N(6))-dimethyltransferase RsmA [Bacillota bacterium]|nr:16S rRNA (adenine(1518)-N(6)/adenine(1519)-N(6))-dimethyltransferase RsmA [Bacillota bacterium]
MTRPRAVAQLLAQFGLQPRKRFGQNFLIDEHILNKIVRAASLSPSDVVLEVGAGLGTLTAALAARAGRVVAVELDRDLFSVLRFTVGRLPNVRLVRGDILDLRLAELLPDDAPSYKAVANLPYYITSPVLLKFLTATRPWERLVFMVQREVADRLTARPGTKAYGSLTVILQFSAEATVVARVPRTAFYPAPEVDSTVVALTPRPSPLPPGPERDVFFRVVRAAFGQRRKTLANALVGGGFPGSAVKAALAEAGLDGGRRGETLSLDEFVTLSRCLSVQILSPAGV